jgi:7-cyano-7-deazaguanine synthase
MRFRIHTPLVHMTKAEIIRRGTELGVDYGLTHSCYVPNAAGIACGRCDACHLRLKGFAEAGLTDPIAYQT